MELWIRSQDKNSLTKVSNLSLQEIKHPVRHDTDYWGIGTYYDNLQMLGKYKTKERALEVLDEIQRILQPTIFMNAEINTNDNSWVESGIIYQKYKDNFDIQELSTYVYEMPQEEMSE